MEETDEDDMKEEKKEVVPGVGDVFENVTIVATGTKKDGSIGDGIFKAPGGFVIIVMGTKKGDVIPKIRIRKVYEKYAFAEVITT